MQPTNSYAAWSTTMHNVAVYGTLKHGGSNSRLLSSSKLVEVGQISGFHMMTNGSYPYAVEDSAASGTIHIEVYEVDEETLENLDGLEGYYGDSTDRQWGNHYERKEITTPSGKKALIYYIDLLPLSRQGLSKVESGEFNHLYRRTNNERNFF